MRDRQHRKLKKKAKAILALLLALAVLVVFSYSALPGTPAENSGEESAAAASVNVTAEALQETIQSDPAETAALLSTVSDREQYEELLRETLDAYYSENNDPEKIHAFTEVLDPEGRQIAARYENAAKERSSTDLDYEKETLLLLADGNTSDRAIRRAVDPTVGTVTTITKAGGKKLAHVDLSLEYSVKEANLALKGADGLLVVQPNYIYGLAEDDTEGADAAGEETVPVEEPPEEQGTVLEEQGEQAVPADETVVEKEEVAEPAEEKEEPAADTSGEPDDAYGISGGKNALFGPSGMNVFAAWDLIPASGSRVKVGVIDTGVNANHEELKNAVITAQCATIENGVTEIGTISDDNGHGTHVCGIIAAEAGNGKGMAGVAAGYRAGGANKNDIVSLVVVDAMYKKGFHSEDLYEALIHLTDCGCRVINMSIGGKGTEGLVEQGMAYAYDRNVTIVVAAGNESTDRLVYPSDSPYAISVINAQSTTERSSRSNFGYEKDVAAPGVDIYSASNAGNSLYVIKSGTSMAAPAVTGVVALALYQEDPDNNLSTRQIRNLLYGSANNDDYLIQTGYGFVKADAMISAFQNPTESVEAVQFNRFSKIMYTGDVYAPEYRVLPAGTTKTDLSWTSGNTSVATVSSDGKITAVAPGNATITASAGGKSDSITVSVRERYQQVPNDIEYTHQKAIYGDSAIGRLECIDENGSPKALSATYINGYKVDLVGGVEVCFTATAVSGIEDPYLAVYDENGKYVAGNDDAIDYDALACYTPEEDQTVYVEVGESPLSEGESLYFGTIEFGLYRKVYEIQNFKVENVTYTTAELSWDPCEGCDGYEIFEYDWDEGVMKSMGTQAGWENTGCTISGIKPGSVCFYAVSPYSSNEHAMTVRTGVEEVVTPAVPVTKLTAKNNGYNSIRLTWTKQSGIDRYQIYRYDSKKKTYVFYKTIDKSATSFTDRGLTTNLKYYYKIRAIAVDNGETVKGAFSSVASATPVMAKTKITKGTGGKGKATLRWAKTTGASGYYIYRSTKSSSGFKLVKTVKSGSTTTYTQKNLSKRTYYYRVKPYRNVTNTFTGKKSKTTGGNANTMKVTVK